MTRVLSVIPNQFTYGSDNVRLAMGKGLDLSVSQPLRVRLHLAKREGELVYLQERITVILLEAAQCSMLHLGKVKVPGKTSGRYLLLDVDPKRIAKLTQQVVTAYHFFHMSERTKL